MRNSAFGFAVIAGIVIVGLWYVYAAYYPEIYDFFGVRTEYPMYISEAYFLVTIADEPEEWRAGLSNTNSLADQTGLLFIFDEIDEHGIWMKDMNYPIDIIWIDESFTVVDFATNVSPDTYPQVFRPDEPARFVLEVPAFTVETFKIQEGQTVRLPAETLPRSLQNL